MNQIRSLLERLARRLKYLWQFYITKNETVRGVDLWYQTFPNSRVLYDLHLPANATVIDVGGYIGEWAAHCRNFAPTATIHIFEPIPEFIQILKQRFKADKRMRVHGFGLGANDRQQHMTLLGEGTSGHREGGEKILCKICDINDVIDKLGVSNIHAMAMNVEGAEYELLPALASKGRLADIDILWIQFHKIDSHSYSNRKKILDILSQTHTAEIVVPFVWEKWVRKSET